MLGINGQSLLGHSNQEALDTLRKALASASGEDAKVQLVVARRKGVNRKAAMQFSTSMGTLGEEPEEVGVMGKVEVCVCMCEGCVCVKRE